MAGKVITYSGDRKLVRKNKDTDYESDSDEGKLNNKKKIGNIGNENKELTRGNINTTSKAKKVLETRRFSDGLNKIPL